MLYAAKVHIILGDYDIFDGNFVKKRQNDKL